MNASPSKRRVNVGVIGLGFMGATHLRAWLADARARVVAVCDPTRLPANGVLPGVAGNIQTCGDLQLGPEVKAYRTLDAMLSDPDVELVDICTPTALHPEQAIAALEAGKHVICEKPLARTSAAAREVLKVSEQTPRLLMPAMCMRFWPGWSLLKQVVAEQVYGRTLAAHFFRLSELPAWSRQWSGGSTDTGGALFDLHIHDTDLVHQLFGRPDSVSSNGVIAENGTVTQVMTQYRYANGPVVSAEGSWLLSSGFNMGYRVQCERATLEFDLSRGAEALRIAEPGRASRVMECPAGDGYTGELAYAVECILEDRAASVVTATDAVAALEICEGEERSIRSGAPVKL